MSKVCSMCVRGTCDTVQFDGPWLKSEPTDANVPMNTSHVRERQILKTTRGSKFRREESTCFQFR